MSSNSASADWGSSGSGSCTPDSESTALNETGTEVPVLRQHPLWKGTASHSDSLYASTCLLISPDQLRLGNDVPLHGLFQLFFVRFLQIGQYDVKRVEFCENSDAGRWADRGRRSRDASSRSGRRACRRAASARPRANRRRRRAGCTAASAPRFMRGAAGSGASGSSTIRTRLSAFAGTSLQSAEEKHRSLRRNRSSESVHCEQKHLK